MHDLLPTEQNPRYSIPVHTYTPWEGEQTSGRMNAQGSILSTRIRAVCDNCNNRWMNQIEGRAKPFLTALIKGEPIVLDYEQMQMIAEWVALKVMVVEHQTHNTAVTTSALRAAFKARRKIPDYFRIYIGSHDGPPMAALYRDSRCISYRGLEFDPPLGGVPNNIQSITMYLGKVFVYVNAARVNGFEIEKGLIIPPLYSQRIWPFMHHELVWPSKPAFTVKQVNDIANGLNRLLNEIGTLWVKP